MTEYPLVKILEDAPIALFWRGKQGHLLRWLHDNTYMVREISTGKELVLRGDEFQVVKEE